MIVNVDNYLRLVSLILDKYKRLDILTFKKIVYLVDFNYYELFENKLLNEVYIYEDNNILLLSLDYVLKLLKKYDILNIYENVLVFNHPQYYLKAKYPQITEFLESNKLSSKEKQVVDLTLNQISDMCDFEIDKYVLNDYPCKICNDGDVIDYEYVYWRSGEYSVKYFNNDNDISIDYFS